jgi:hypothetical protein
MHRFPIGRDLLVQYLLNPHQVAVLNARPIVKWYPGQIRAQPPAIGGDNWDWHQYEVRYFDERNPYNAHPEGINTVEEVEYQEQIDAEASPLEKLRLLRGSVRIQVCDPDIGDAQARYDENNFYYYCLNSGRFFTQARDAVIQAQRDWIDRKVSDPKLPYQIGDMIYIQQQWVQAPGTRAVGYNGDGRRRRNLNPPPEDEGADNDDRRVRRRIGE